MTFKVGDTVQLKSGGPFMTVEQTGTTAMTGQAGVWCVWFEKVGNRQVAQRETFHPETLKAAERGISSVRLQRG